jgi:opacity protein-like surface antigen
VTEDGLNVAAGVCEGAVLDGKYRVERVLGVGGMGVVVALVSALNPSTARAQLAIGHDALTDSGAPVPAGAPTAPFGAPGQFVITGASSAGVSWETYDGSEARYFTASLSPGLDYFVLRNFAIGVNLNAAYGDSRGYGADGSLVDTRTTTLSVGPRAALNIPLADSFSIYPRLTLSVEWVRTEEQAVSGATLSTAGSPVGYPSTTQIGPIIDLYVPLLFQVCPHFFIGGGPYLDRALASVQGGPNVGGQQTTLGAGVVVGGTWGGVAPTPPRADGPAVPETPRRRFGDAGVIALDSEISASIAFTWYEGTGSSSLTGGFEPSLDYFFLDHVSLGMAPFVSYSRTVGVDASNGAAVVSERSSVGVEARVGADLPLGRWLSIYGRAGLVFSSVSYDETSAGSADDYSTAIDALHIYAPLLVHPAPHLFAGFGPSLYWEFSDAATFPNGASVQNRATQVGASLTVGGWL